MVASAVIIIRKRKASGTSYIQNTYQSPTVLIADDFMPPTDNSSRNLPLGGVNYTPMMQIDPNTYLTQNEQSSLPENELLANLPYESNHNDQK